MIPKAEHVKDLVKYYCLYLDWTFEIKQHHTSPGWPMSELSLGQVLLWSSHLAREAGSCVSSAGVLAGEDSCPQKELWVWQALWIHLWSTDDGNALAEVSDVEGKSDTWVVTRDLAIKKSLCMRPLAVRTHLVIPETSFPALSIPSPPAPIP